MGHLDRFDLAGNKQRFSMLCLNACLNSTIVMDAG